MAQFKIIEKTAALDNRENLPDPIDFSATHAAGTKADFGNGEIYVLTAPRDWTWERQRGKSAKSTDTVKSGS